MTTKSTDSRPILVIGAAGAIGAIGRNLTAMLLEKGHTVRALVRREDERAEDLRRIGADHAEGRYDRLTDDLYKLTGKVPTSTLDFVKLNASEFSRDGTSA
ncbi:hypothetical protein UB46_41245 [Burkholderiaceae bacterium 16]|nr:hypothetical protein UB46_41245 [Burkholderiaceae bacterium 16]